MWSRDPRTHKMDNWMVKFLLNHALSLPKKYTEHQTLEMGLDTSNEQPKPLSLRTTVTSQAFSTLLFVQE